MKNNYTRLFQYESDAQKSIVEFLKNLRKAGQPIRHFKAAQGQFSEAGVSDVISCYRGLFYALEIKAKDGKPTHLQSAFGSDIIAAGGTFAIVHNVSEVAQVLGIEI